MKEDKKESWLTKLGRKNLGQLTNGERSWIIFFIILVVIGLNWVNEKMSQEAHLITLGIMFAVFISAVIYGAVTWISHLRKRG